MDHPSPSDQILPQSVENDRRARKVRRFASGMTLVMILVCNAIFLSGLWWSGVNLDRLVRTPDQFNPKEDICLRLNWQKVNGSSELVRLCSEWIRLSDPSGATHQFQHETEVKQDAQGRLYFDHGALVDYRLFVLVLFVAGVVAFGIATKRFLVSRYRIRLEASAAQHAQSLH
jgi:hypothetical protein